MEASAVAGLQHYQEWDSGYSKQQGTRPQTLGYALVDSPAGQAASNTLPLRDLTSMTRRTPAGDHGMSQHR